MSATKKEPYLPESMKEAALSALRKRYGGFLKFGEHFSLEGRAEPDAFTLVLTLENADKSLYVPAELAFVIADNPKSSPDEAREVLLDFGDYFFDRYFKEGRSVTLPIDWEAFPIGDHEVRARGWERNRRLEELADRLLAGESIDDV